MRIGTLGAPPPIRMLGAVELMRAKVGESEGVDLPESREGPPIVSHRSTYFSIYWERGLVYVRYNGALLKSPSAYGEHLAEHESTLATATRSMPGAFVSLIDMLHLEHVHGAFAREGAAIIRRQSRSPVRRAVRVGQDRYSRSHAAIIRLATGGRARLFGENHLEELVDWLCEPGTVDPYDLYRLLDHARGRL